jgi:hypothetical protein
MKKTITFILLLLIVFAACKKYNSLRDDINGTLYLRGRLFRVNTITNKADTSVVASATVNIGYFPDTVNYIYSVTTDANGYFVFNNLVQGKHYELTTSDSTGGIMYNVRKDIQLDTSFSSVRLFSLPAQSTQNGVVYTVTDQGSGRVTGCTVCMFASKYLYNQALLADTCIGGSYVLTTNGFGRASQVNLPDTVFHVFFRTYVNKATILRGYDSISVPKYGILNRTVVIK